MLNIIKFKKKNETQFTDKLPDFLTKDSGYQIRFSSQSDIDTGEYTIRVDSQIKDFANTIIAESMVFNVLILPQINIASLIKEEKEDNPLVE